MQPTDVLTSEHRVIEQVLNCLEKMARACERENRLDADAARRAIDFFRTFADRCHHAKEEDSLFPMLEAKGLVRESGPTGVMLREHELGRRYLRDLSTAVDAVAAGEKAALFHFADAARSYIHLLREHIAKEDYCLFPMAKGVLSAVDQQAVLDRFAEVEAGHLGAGTHEKYLRVARELAKQFHVPSIPEAECCACGHAAHA